jgi:indole-3-glycerol phosphate synthase
MSADVLLAAMAAARRSASERQRTNGTAVLDRACADRQPRGDRFRTALSSPGLRIIAECKRRSPSRGVLRAAYDPAAIAAGYAQAGAAAISVLTEPTFFDGSLDHLKQVRAVVEVPLLRKDFVSIEYQLLEAAACGADAALLIVAALDDASLRRLLLAARALGLAALVETHDEREIDRAVAAGARIIGVNSRNLRTLDVDPRRFDELASRLPSGVVAVAESGLRAAADLERLHAARYDAFLIGERFMTTPDPGQALATLLAPVERP